MSLKIHRRRRSGASNSAPNRLNCAVVEALEDRQLLSLMIDVRAADGSKAISVSSVGQVVTLNVFAVIQGNANPSQDGVQDVQGSFLSTNIAGFGPVAGNLAAQNIAPFDASGASPGTAQDLNADGNLDVGGPDPTKSAGFFFSRAPSEQLGALEFQVGTLSYTVTNLHFGGEVDVNYRPRLVASPASGVFAAIWVENGSGFNNFNGTLLTGTPVKITDVAAQPTGPVAVADVSNAVTGVENVVNVLANDGDAGGTITGATVNIVSQPNHGGTAVVDPTTQAIDYTSGPNFFGTETLSYTFTDTNGMTSAPATVTFTVNPPSPTTVNDSATTFVNQAVSVAVLSNDASVAGFNPSTVTVTTNPTNGTATVNSDGSISYSPAAGFVGSDTFAYQAADNNGTLANISTVKMTVGVEISSAKGGNKSVLVSDVDGTTAIITLNHGIADITLNGTGVATISHGKVVITGTGLTIGAVTVSGTTAASALIMGGGGGDGVITVGSISDAGVLGKIMAPVANLSGNLSVAGLATLQLGNAVGAAIEIGGGGSTKLSVKAGAINNSSLSATSENLTVQAGSMVNSSVTALTGKSFKVAGNVSGSVISFAGGVAPVVTAVMLGGSLSSSQLTVGNAKLTLTAAACTSVSVNSGSAQSIKVAADVSGSAFNFAGLSSGASPNHLAVGGKFQSSTFTAVGNTAAVALGSMTNSALSTGATGSVKVGGDVSGSVLNFSGPTGAAVALGHLTVAGQILNSSVQASGSIASITAGALNGASLTAGIAAGTTLLTASAANLGSSKIGSIKLTAASGAAFSNSAIIAHAIGPASLGVATTSNQGSVDGLAASSYQVVTLNTGSPVVLTEAELAASPAVFGDLVIAVK